MELAVEAGNIDMSQVSTTVQGLVGKVLDNYGEKLTNAMEDLESGYSFQKQMEVAKIRTKFQSDIGTLVGLGNNLKTVAEVGKYDNMLSVEPINGNTQFTLELPKMLDSFDPENLSVGGVKITDLYKSKVDMSKLYAPVDSQKDVMEFVDQTLEEGVTELVINGNKVKTYKESSYKPQEAKANFIQKFDGTQSFKKEALKLARIYNDLEGPEKEEFAIKYMKDSQEGEPTVSVDGLWRYVEDNYLEPAKRKLVAVKPSDPDAGAIARSQKAKEELLDSNRKIEMLHEATSTNGIVGLKNHPITVDGKKGTILEGRKSYNPITGKSDIEVTYSLSDSPGNVGTYTKRYEDSETGMQALSWNVYGQFDYIDEKDKLGVKIGSNITKPVTGITFQERNAGVEKLLNDRDWIPFLKHFFDFFAE
jgi:hypothetical protein